MLKLGERFLLIREYTGLNQADFSNKIGISQSFLSAVERNAKIPGSDILIVLKNLFDVDGNWLLTGDGDMFKKPHEPAIKKPLSANTELLNEPFKEEFAQLKQQVQYLFRFLPGKLEEPQSVPLYDQCVCTGEGFSEVEEYINFPRKYIKHPKNTYAVKVCGDSMVGTGIYNGDILLVDKSVEWRHGYIAIVSLNNELMCKKIIQEEGKLYLEPANAKHKKIELKNQTSGVLGIVVAIFHPTV